MSAERIIAAALPVAIALLTACGSGEDVREETAFAVPAPTTVQPLRKPDPCATVLCLAGYHCESRGRRASCVADTPNPSTCTSDADCRLYDNYCNGCSCEALSLTDPDPVCNGTIVACVVQPCGGQTAVCLNGTCSVASATP